MPPMAENIILYSLPTNYFKGLILEVEKKKNYESSSRNSECTPTSLLLGKYYSIE